MKTLDEIIASKVKLRNIVSESISATNNGIENDMKAAEYYFRLGLDNVSRHFENSALDKRDTSERNVECLKALDEELETLTYVSDMIRESTTVKGESDDNTGASTEQDRKD